MRPKGQKRGNNKAGAIVVRKEEVTGQAPHGGAWKVAYADFVTAMMAFFLLMWLINATTEAQRKGLANYFAPSNVLSFHYSGSGKPFGGRTAFSPGQMVSDAGAVQAITGKVQPVPNGRPDPHVKTPGTVPPEQGTARRAAPGPAPVHAESARGGASAAAGLAGPDIGAPALPLTGPAGAASPAGKAAEREQAAFEGAAAQIRAAIRGDPDLVKLAKQIAIDVTPQGLRIQILDGRREPMFQRGATDLLPPAKLFIERLTPILVRLAKPLDIAGYTDAAPYRGTDMTNWELSTERANATRRLLMANGLPEAQIARITGYADRDLLLPAEPLAAQNRRITILVRRTANASPSPPCCASASASIK